ncbi:MAG: RsiV family protein, partial [Alsobacter sp.]
NEMLAQIAEQKKARDSLPSTADDKAAYAKSISAGLSDFGNWSLSPAGAWIVFNPYELGSYAEGSYECTLPLPALRRLSKGLPLPEEG